MESVSARWLGEKRTEIVVGEARRLTAATNGSAGDHEAGASPGELLLASVASCMCLAVAHIAQKRRVSLAGLSVNAWCAAERESFRLTEVRLTVKADLPTAELRPLVAVAERYCFVSNTLRNGCAVATEVEEVAPMEANG